VAYWPVDLCVMCLCVVSQTSVTQYASMPRADSEIVMPDACAAVHLCCLLNLCPCVCDCELDS
jgi:hypothetical protein